MVTTLRKSSNPLEDHARKSDFGPVSQQGISDATLMGANLISGGATFRVWAPQALEVHLRMARKGNTINADGDPFRPSPDTKLQLGADGHWTGFVQGVQDGDRYRFHVIGNPQPLVRDPYARELAFQGWPDVDCIVRSSSSYPWHDTGFRTPWFHEAIIYQLHFGTWYAVDNQSRDERPNRIGKFLDAVERIPYLAELGVTFIQPLPVTEFNSVPNPFDPTPRSLGYNGTDMFSPEMDYSVEEKELPRYLIMVNRLLADKGQPPLELKDLVPQVNQLKVFVDLCHLSGMAVIFDAVYNHAGGFFGDEQNLYQFRDDNGGELYFMQQGWAGGLVFDFNNDGVRQFLIDNARFFLDEYHVDGFRYDEVSVIDQFGGWHFCQDLTATVKHHRPSSLHHAEYWKDQPFWATRSRDENGAGFNTVLTPGIRDAVRRAVAQAAGGQGAKVNLDSVRDSLRHPFGFAAANQVVNCLETHDRQRVQNDNDREPRIAALADSTDARSWYARSRSRVANGLLLTAAGLPMLFMGQEFLEDKYWTDDPDNHPGNLIWWDGLSSDRSMQDHLKFMQDLIWLRRRHPALQAGSANPFYVHNDNRILAFHRWIEGIGLDVIVVASLNESTFDQYELGFPQSGPWFEVFNSDFYDNFPNPWVAGNASMIEAFSEPRDGMPCSATIRIPANGLSVFSRNPVH